MNFNLNILAYGIYFLITAVIIVKIGWMFYVNGAHYLHDLFVNDNETADTLNKMLLMGYYLLNLGYVAVSLGYWPHIDTNIQLIELIAERTGFIALGLALMHYINMAWVQLAKRFFKTN
jgi:hypothetical protein